MSQPLRIVHFYRLYMILYNVDYQHCQLLQKHGSCIKKGGYATLIQYKGAFSSNKIKIAKPFFKKFQEDILLTKEYLYVV